MYRKEPLRIISTGFLRGATERARKYWFDEIFTSRGFYTFNNYTEDRIFPETCLFSLKFSRYCWNKPALASAMVTIYLNS